MIRGKQQASTGVGDGGRKGERSQGGSKCQQMDLVKDI